MLFKGSRVSARVDGNATTEGFSGEGVVDPKGIKFLGKLLRKKAARIEYTIT